MLGHGKKGQYAFKTIDCWNCSVKIKNHRQYLRFYQNPHLFLQILKIFIQNIINMPKKAPSRSSRSPAASKKATKPSKPARSVSKAASRSVSKGPRRVPAPKTKRIVKAVKKIRRSRSMEETIREGEEFLAHRKSILAQKESKRAAVLKNKKASEAKTKSTARKSKPAASKPAASKPSPPVAVSPPANAFRRTGTSKSKVSSGSKVNLKHDPTLPLPQFGVIDVCFCIDATGSMTSYLAEAKKTVLDIINKIQTKVQTEGIELRFAVVTYRDHPPQESTYVTKVQDFTDDRAIRTYLEKLDAFGGGDFAEAVHDGLLVAAKDLTWRNYPMIPSLRYIFHIADAPPHGKQFDEGAKNGCTCGISTDAVTHAINYQQIHYRLIKINAHPHLNKMEEIFKKSIVDFDSAEIKNASEMNIKVSDMIIREIMPM